jgi:O-antigen/teichoic acid export membrane protein
MPSAPSDPQSERPATPILASLWRGTAWLALKMPLQIVIAFWSIPMIQRAIGADANGAYVFAWGLGFIQLLLEFGMGAALQQQLAHAWAVGDRPRVGRLIGLGMTFYAAVAVIQVAILLAIAYLGLPPKFHGESRRLIIGLLWVQALSAPFYGLMTVTSCVLQAGGRYELLPRIDLLVMILRFAVLVAGLRAGVDFLAIVAVQTIILLAGTLVPALRVMRRDLGCVPHFVSPRRDDFRTLFHVSVYVFLMQLSVVLADMVDTTILTYALPDLEPGPSITLYQNVSKPFFQLRQMGWTLVYLVIPAAASLAATRDLIGGDKLKYDGTRHLVALLLPTALLAAMYAAPFLNLWVGPAYVPHAWLLQLFLVGTLPLVLAVFAKMAFGMGKYEVLSLSSLAGSLVNLPLSYYLTTRLGVAGVIWGTVLTTLVSNLLLPGRYLFRLLNIRVSVFLTRSLGPPLIGAAIMVGVSWACQAILPPGPSQSSGPGRAIPLLINLAVCSVGYAVGYLALPTGRDDMRSLLRFRLRRSG